ncbi:MAG: DUF2169 domain-containing protein [Sandaracinaceae bacterium]|nr:DUF2169 domain-containing protein [Sandaracinaceae bacterium]
MSLPEVSARVDATIDRFELFELDGARALAIVLKQRFAWDAKGGVHRVAGAVIHPVDVPFPDAQSTMFPGDVLLRKPAVDVVVSGTARADRPVPALDVRVEVGPLAKSLRVFGPRVWYHPALGAMRPSDPASFDQLPLIWEHAYGGMDVSDPEKLAHEPRNPLGRGVAAHPEALEGQPLPQIEDPRDPIQTSRSRPAPAGIGALSPSFQPRLGYAGTFDQRWQDERMPLFPEDFDPRFHQVAHPELVGTLRGGEPVRLLNLGQPGPAQFELPRLVFSVDARADGGQTTSLRPELDTVLILPDEQALELTYRTTLPLRSGPRAIRELLVFEKRVLR